MLGLVLVSCSSQPQFAKLIPSDVILAYGDSLTFGTGAKPSQSYPSVLQQLTGFKVVNAGVPGELTARGLERLAEVLAQEQPKLMILCHGGNDLLRKSGDLEAAYNLRSMVELAHHQGIEVILVAVPKPTIFLNEPEFYSLIAKEYNLPILDELLANILSKNALKSDVIHPNAAGYEVMAEAIYQLMKEKGSI